MNHRTFIKRKAGLFKKAHELAVLCQVEVSVIILGSNNTFYEFSSVDTDDLIKHYKRKDLPHDIKTPADYGDYIKKSKVVLSDRKKRKQASFFSEPVSKVPAALKSKGEDDDDDLDDDMIQNGNDLDGEIPSNDSQQSSKTGVQTFGLDGRLLKKRFRSGDNSKFNFLQQHVQKKFHNLYNAASTYVDQQEPQSQRHVVQAGSPHASKDTIPSSLVSPPTSQSSAMGPSVASAPSHQHQQVQDSSMLPAFQKSYNPYHPSERLQSQNTSAPPLPVQEPIHISQHQQPTLTKQVTRPVLRVHIPTSNSTGSIKSSSTSNNINEGGAVIKNSHDTDGTPVSALDPAISINNIVIDRSKNYLLPSEGTGMPHNNPPFAFDVSPSMRQYFASPLQNVAHTNNNDMMPSLQTTLFQPAGRHPNSISICKSQQAEPSVGPMLGFLPSKYVSDLMVASPTNASITMFHEWPFNRVPQNQNSTAFNTNQDSLHNNLPNSGASLTSYINTSMQTPLVGRYFNFPTESQSEEKQNEDKT